MRERIHLSCPCRQCKTGKKYARRKAHKRIRMKYRCNIKHGNYEPVEISLNYTD